MPNPMMRPVIGEASPYVFRRPPGRSAGRSSILSGVKAQLAIKLFGPDLDVLAEKGKAIEGLARKVEGTRDVEMEQIVGEAQLTIRPRRDLLARYGIPVAQVMELVASNDM